MSRFIIQKSCYQFTGITVMLPIYRSSVDHRITPIYRNYVNYYDTEVISPIYRSHVDYHNLEVM